MLMLFLPNTCAFLGMDERKVFPLTASWSRPSEEHPDISPQLCVWLYLFSRSNHLSMDQRFLQPDLGRNREESMHVLVSHKRNLALGSWKRRSSVSTWTTEEMEPTHGGKARPTGSCPEQQEAQLKWNSKLQGLKAQGLGWGLVMRHGFSTPLISVMWREYHRPKEGIRFLGSAQRECKRKASAERGHWYPFSAVCSLFWGADFSLHQAVTCPPQAGGPGSLRGRAGASGLHPIRATLACWAEMRN